MKRPDITAQTGQPNGSLTRTLARAWDAISHKFGAQAAVQPIVETVSQLQTWANTQPTITRLDTEVLWTINIPQPFVETAFVQHYPSCCTLSILRTDPGESNQGAVDTYRRTIPFADGIPDTNPEIRFEGTKLTLSFPTHSHDQTTPNIPSAIYFDSRVRSSHTDRR